MSITDFKKATAGLTYYVDAAGDDSTGDGSIGTPWATINYAVSQIPKNLDSLGSVAIVVNDGTYNSHDKVEIHGFFNGMLQIYSSGFVADNCVINFTSAGAGTDCFDIVGCTATIYIQYMTLNVATNNRACIYAEHASRVIAEGCDFGTNGVATGTYGVWANYGSIVTVDTPADAGANVVNVGIRAQTGSVVQLISPTSFGTTFLSQAGGLINEDSSLYSAGNINLFPNNTSASVFGASDTSILGSLFLDEDDMASNSEGALASQQSIKAYADLHIKHSLAAAANDFLVASGAGVFVKKTLAEVGAILETDLDHGNLQGLAGDDHTQYILVDGSRAFTGAILCTATNMQLQNATNPYIMVTDTSNTAQAILRSLESSAYVGSNSNHDFHIYANDVSVMRFIAAGGVDGSVIKDEDTMASDSATHLCTQQSIKAYADTMLPLAGPGPMTDKYYRSAEVGNVRAYKDLYVWEQDTAAITGTMRINLGTDWTATMQHLIIDIYSYSEDAVATLRVGGYSNSAWSNSQYSWSGSIVPANYDVRLAYNTTLSEICVLIGSTASVWRYPKVVVRQHIVGYSGESNFGGTYSLDIISSEATVSNIHSPSGGAIYENLGVLYGDGISTTGAANKVVKANASGDIGETTGFRYIYAQFINLDGSDQTDTITRFWVEKSNDNWVRGMTMANVVTQLQNQGLGGSTDVYFHVKKSAQQSNMAASTETITWETETEDGGADFDISTETFTAPEAGMYLFTWIVNVLAIDTAANQVEIRLITSNDNYRALIDPNLSADAGWNFQGSMIVDMDASDTAYIQWYQSGGAVQSDAWTESYFSGVLLATSKA
jgi:hypothetical protein